jgi:hypothetical protein
MLKSLYIVIALVLWYNANMAHGADTLPLVSETPQMATERLFEVSQVAGFLATSRTELNEAYTLLDVTDTVTHLDEIRIHQKRYDVPDPMEAVRSVVTGYRDFARRAHFDKTALWDLDDELGARRSAIPITSLANLDLPGGHLSGVPQLVRYRDLHMHAEGKPLGKDAFFPLYPYHDSPHRALDAYTVARPGQQAQARIETVTKAVRLHEARKLVNPAITDQQNRADFWTDRLMRARLHPMVTATANAMLRSLSITHQA